MEACFVYWDNSNIFVEAQRLAAERDEGPAARYRVRIHFDNLLRLAHADRPVQRAYAAGSIPSELRQLWNRMEARGVEVSLFDRGEPHRGEQDMPDRISIAFMEPSRPGHEFANPRDPAPLALEFRRRS